MNKISVIISIIGLTALGGFLFIQTRPDVQPPTNTQQLESDSKQQVQGQSDQVPINQVTKSPNNTNTQQNMAQNKQYSAPPEMQIDPQKTYTATMETTKGNMIISLDPTETPNTVNNFVFLANEGFYDNTKFHRIISGFMIQGGDPLGNGTGDPGYKFDDEPISKPYDRGVVAMANSGPNTNGSQFFVMHQDYQLPPNYVIFGQIDPQDTESLTTLDAIAATPVTQNMFGEKSTPTEEVLINRITITETQ